MSHRHFCDYAGHEWDCTGSALRPIAGHTEPSTCMCLRHHVPMEDGDHSECSIELLACPEHREAQLSEMRLSGPTMRADKNLKSLESPDAFEQMLAELATPESKLKFDQKNRFEREVIYAGLTDLNTGFDSDLIGHFSPEDFLIVIDRCEALNVEVIGIEVFTTDVEPPWKVGFLEVKISPEYGGYDWARRLVREYMERSDITICATFKVPDALLKSNPKQGGEPNR
jgi:hypothetical protein